MPKNIEEFLQENAVQYNIEERIAALNKKIDDYNKNGLTQNGLNGMHTINGSVIFSFQNSPEMIDSVKLITDNNGQISEGERKAKIAEQRRIGDELDLNHDGKVDAKEMTSICSKDTGVPVPFTNRQANILISQAAQAFAATNTEPDELKKFIDLVDQIKKDGILTVAEQEALQKFSNDHHLGVKNSPPSTPAPALPKAAPAPEQQQDLIKKVSTKA